MKVRHPHIKPDVIKDVPDDKVAAHVAAGWVPVTEDPVETPAPVVVETPERPGRRANAKEND